MSDAAVPFAWGATWSSLQTEGVAPSADWSAWERSGKAPSSSDGSGFRTDWRDDLALMAELGLNAIRMTVEWARIEPTPGRVDSTQLDWYSDVIGHARSLGLAPWVTLHSGSLPGWFAEDERGFRDDRAREYYWVRHVDRCAARFGDDVSGWTPIEDPIGWALRGFHLASRPPGLSDQQLLRDAVTGALEADHRAAQLLASGGARTMAVRGVPTLFAADDDASPQVSWWAGFLFDSWIEVLGSGELKVPDLAVKIRERWVDDFDYVGLVFDHPVGVTGEGDLCPWPAGDRRADTGFVPVPDELRTLLERMADRVDRPLVIAGNGVATTDDEWREELLRSTIDVVTGARADGINLVGYFHDTLIDGYEGRMGFNTNRGLIDRDRNVKESGRFLQAWIAQQQ